MCSGFTFVDFLKNSVVTQILQFSFTSFTHCMPRQFFANAVINAYDVLFLFFHLCQDRMFFTMRLVMPFLIHLHNFSSFWFLKFFNFQTFSTFPIQTPIITMLIICCPSPTFADFPTFDSPVTTFSTLSLLICPSTLIPSMSMYCSWASRDSVFMPASFQIADPLFNTMTATLRSSTWSLTILNSSFNTALQIPRLPSFLSVFPDRHKPARWDESSQAVAWQLSSGCDSSSSIHPLCAATDLQREVRLSCHPEHLTRE